MSKKNNHSSLQEVKRPSWKLSPDSEKVPRAIEFPNDDCRPEFKAHQMDVNGPWGWDKLEAIHLQDFLQKIFDSQKLTWQILRERGSHLIDTASLVKSAQKRLCDLEKDDLDQLYSLRLSGKKRVWGIKEGNILWLLWWDPLHQICPADKKHT